MFLVVAVPTDSVDDGSGNGNMVGGFHGRHFLTALISLVMTYFTCFLLEGDKVSVTRGEHLLV